jgi:glutaredoxin-related protein
VNVKRGNLIEVMDTYEEYYRKLFINERVRAFNEIEEILNSYAIIIFIRGPPNEPKCPQSQLLVEYFTKMEIKFRSYDILGDNRLKEWLKFYSNWPSYP